MIMRSPSDDMRHILGAHSFRDMARNTCPGLELIGSGMSAHVYRHPLNEGLVVRASDTPDGWFLTAARQLQYEEMRSRFMPDVVDLVHQDGIWIALARRLEEVPAECAWQVSVAQRIIAPHEGRISRDELDRFGLAQPGFAEYAKGHLRFADDVGSQNFMWDGGVLIANDIFSKCGIAYLNEIGEIFDISRVEADCGPSWP